MKRTASLGMAALFLLSAGWAHTAKTTYIATNHRFNYVKLKEVGEKDAASRGITHPATLDEQGLRSALASINLARSHIIKKEADTQQVFDDYTLDFLAPNFAKAFAQAGAGEIVVFSYLTKSPYFIIRNDRLNIGEAWLTGSELHLRFQKLNAKVTGDIDRRGNETRAIAHARGLRVRLEAGEGQSLNPADTDEIVLNIHHDYSKKPEAPTSKVGVTMAGERAEEAPQTEVAPPPAKGKGAKGAKKAGAEAAGADSKGGEASQAPPSVKERLENLKQLKDEGLISKKEYEEKRKDILQGL